MPSVTPAPDAALLRMLDDHRRRLEEIERSRQGAGDPVGRVEWLSLPSAPAGWIVADGTTVGSTYPVYRAALVAAGSPFGFSSGNPHRPNMIDRFPRGGTNLTVSGGNESMTTALMPAHGHPPGTLATTGGGHEHTYAWHRAVDAASGTALGMFDPHISTPNQSRNTAGGGAHSHGFTGNVGNTGSGGTGNNLPPYQNLLPIIRAY